MGVEMMTHVGAKGGDEFAIDLDGVVGHAGDGALGDDDVVEGVPTRGAPFRREPGVRSS